MSIGKKLYALRKQKGLSQEYVANSIAVSRQAVSKWERDESVPDIENIKQLSVLFKVSIDYLVHDDITHDDNIPIAVSLADICKEKYREKYHKYFLVVIGFVFLITLFNQVMQLSDVPFGSYMWRLTFGIGAPIAKLWAIILLLFAVYSILFFITREQKQVGCVQAKAGPNNLSR